MNNGKGGPKDGDRLNLVKKLLEKRTTKAAIARQLDISRQALWQYIRRHNLDGRRRRKLPYFLKRERGK